jgi:hypothetical protein
MHHGRGVASQRVVAGAEEEWPNCRAGNAQCHSQTGDGPQVRAPKEPRPRDVRGDPKDALGQAVSSYHHNTRPTGGKHYHPNRHHRQTQHLDGDGEYPERVGASGLPHRERAARGGFRMRGSTRGNRPSGEMDGSNAPKPDQIEADAERYRSVQASPTAAVAATTRAPLRS